MTAKQNQKFPFHFFFRFAAEGWGEEAREKCKEIFWFLHTRVRERVRGAHHSASGFNSKNIRTLSNRYRNKTKSGFPPKNASAQSADDWAEFPPNPIPAKIFHAPRGSLVTNTNL